MNLIYDQVYMCKKQILSHLNAEIYIYLMKTRQGPPQSRLTIPLTLYYLYCLPKPDIVWLFWWGLLNT